MKGNWGSRQIAQSFRRNVALQALAAWVILSVTAPSHANLITIEPDDFAANENISYVMPGARLSAVSKLADGTLVESAVIARQLDSSCIPSPGLPTCAATGQKLFGHDRPSLSNSHLWGEVEDAVAYFQGSPIDAPFFRTVLRVDFETPTNYVDVLGAFWNGDSVGMSAFNAAGQEVSRCILGGVPGAEPGDCRSVYSEDAIGPSGVWGWYRTSVTSAMADISFVLIGGAANYRQLDQIRFAIPEPGTSVLLGVGLAMLLVVQRRRRITSSKFARVRQSV